MAVIKIVPMPGAVGDKGDEGAPGSVGPQGERGFVGAPGTNAVWSYQGAWNSASAYAVGDVVVYQGQLYYTKSVTTAGTLPTVTAKFDLIAAKGADGTPGTAGAGFGIFYLGNYNQSSGYVPDIAVVRGSDGQLYLAKASGQLGDPVGNTAQWEVWIPKGADGTNGTNGTNGADALWNYTGEYSGGASYAVGDVVTYDGQLWYRFNSNGGNVGDTPSPGLWNLLAAKGADGSGSADIADFVFTETNYLQSSISLPGDKGMTIAAGENSDLYLTAGEDIFIQTLGSGNDINLNAADDIRFTTSNDITDNNTIHSWTMNSEGQLHLPGNGYIENPIASSGDGLGNDTLKLVPHEGIGDQYIIIDPTDPNHIHIRAGGVQDASTANLFLGAERTGVEVSDMGGYSNSGLVTIRSKNADNEGLEENINTVSNTTMIVGFGIDGFTGATVGQLNIGDWIIGESFGNDDAKYTINSAIQNSTQGEYTAISEAGNLYEFQAGMPYTIYRSMGESRWEFGNDTINFPDDTFQTTAFGGGATGTFTSQDNKTVTVTNGIITSIV